MSFSVRPVGVDRSTAGPPAERLRAALSWVILAVLRWQELARQRRALAALSDHMLKDLGLTRVDALREAGRPFWDDGGERWRLWR
ncbi:MAG: putative conserved small protein [Geminicoccaceae bacterium]|jgi:uncharacterized protein YjiS (DUF1127 family)|nr:putative conserved small protein [Geminicoccaceae bacterium]